METGKTIHVSVMLKEVIEGLQPKTGETILDATLGGGGHAEALCQAIGEKGTLVGFDADADALRRATVKLAGCPCRFIGTESNFRFLKKQLQKRGIEAIDKAVFDLGLSSDQLEQSGRGFSLSRHEPLLMTFSLAGGKLTASDIVNTFSVGGLTDLFRLYGEMPQAKRVAEAIVRRRETAPFEYADDLAECIAKALPPRRESKIHPATIAFQALRMAVNDELLALEEGLSQAFELLRDGGRLAVISFHSGEDRVVKNFMRRRAVENHLLLTKKPLTPSPEEIIRNPRSRSAKLRLIQKK